MAPLPEDEAGGVATFFTTLLKRLPTASPSPAAKPSSSTLDSLTAHAHSLLKRDTSTPNYDSGVTPPSSIPNKAVFALFGLIGVGIVCTGIWFFFWAKNGGFYFKETDWDDYKSTVLRRKGPNGTTLSGATESTDLGGGSIVHGESEKGARSIWGRKKGKKNKKGGKRYTDFEEETEYTGSAGGSTLGSEMSELKSKIRKDRKKAKKEARLRGGDLGSEMGETVTVMTEVDPDVEAAMRSYRHEKPARVGGLNKESDASAWDGSTDRDGSTAASELLSHREKTPTNTPTKEKKHHGGIRKVVSTSQPPASTYSRASQSTRSAEEDERIKAEAKKLQEKGRAAQRRDFSFQTGDDSTVDGSEYRSARREEREARRASRSPTKKVPGSYYNDSEIGSAVSSDIGTKSYHHPIPGLSTSGGSEYAEERRKKRNGGGYRRGRRDSLSDDGN
ncbi:hypothetical protein B0J14DRAFT_599141 [Halenospora varia]|nr:hypothetical protein B0J14DRAFT_599141 [Halenospora varia]